MFGLIFFYVAVRKPAIIAWRDAPWRDYRMERRGGARSHQNQFIRVYIQKVIVVGISPAAVACCCGNRLDRAVPGWRRDIRRTLEIFYYLTSFGFPFRIWKPGKARPPSRVRVLFWKIAYRGA